MASNFQKAVAKRTVTAKPAEVEAPERPALRPEMREMTPAHELRRVLPSSASTPLTSAKAPTSSTCRPASSLTGGRMSGSATRYGTKRIRLTRCSSPKRAGRKFPSTATPPTRR